MNERTPLEQRGFDVNAYVWCVVMGAHRGLRPCARIQIAARPRVARVVPTTCAARYIYLHHAACRARHAMLPNYRRASDRAGFTQRARKLQRTNAR